MSATAKPSLPGLFSDERSYRIGPDPQITFAGWGQPAKKLEDSKVCAWAERVIAAAGAGGGAGMAGAAKESGLLVNGLLVNGLLVEVLAVLALSAFMEIPSNGNVTENVSDLQRLD